MKNTILPRELAETLDRRADIELSCGRAEVAERLAHKAAALREGGRADG